MVVFILLTSNSEDSKMDNVAKKHKASVLLCLCVYLLLPIVLYCIAYCKDAKIPPVLYHWQLGYFTYNKDVTFRE